jgi:hypothetical protein
MLHATFCASLRERIASDHFLPIGSNNVFVNQFASLCGAGQEGFSVWFQRDLVRHQLGEIAGEPPAPNFSSRLLAETL